MGSRGFLFRFIHFYFFMYVFYFKSINFFRKSFFFYRQKGFKKSLVAVFRDEFRLYRWCVGRIFRRYKYSSFFSRARPKRAYGSFVSLRFILFSYIWRVHNSHISRLLKRHRGKRFIKRAKGRPRFRFTLSPRKWAFLYRRCLAYILLRRSVQRDWLERFGIAKKHFDRYKSKFSFFLRTYSGKFFYSFVSFFRCLKGELMRFFLYGFFKPYFFKFSFFDMKTLYSKAIFSRRILLMRKRKNKKLRRKRKLIKSRALYRLRQRSLFFKGLSCKFSIGFLSFESGAAISSSISSAYDFFLSSSFVQFLSNKFLRYRFFGYENFLSRLLRYRVFRLKQRRLLLGLGTVKKSSRHLKAHRRFKR